MRAVKKNVKVKVGILLGAVLLITLFMAPLSPLSLFDYDRRRYAVDSSRLSLYFESADASAPVTIKLTATVNEYQGGLRAFFRCIRGTWLGYRPAYATINLAVGQYSESKAVEVKVNRVHRGYQEFHVTIEGVFNVYAVLVVPSMELDLDEDGNEIADRGHLPFEIGYTFSFENGPTYSDTIDGTAAISIIGDVSDYIGGTTPPEPDDPAQPPPSDEDPEQIDDDGEDPFDVDDTENLGDDGGSIFSGEPQDYNLVVFVAVVLVIFAVLWLRARKARKRK